MTFATNLALQDFSEKTPIKIEFPGYSDLPTLRQTVTFESCIFENLQYGPTDIFEAPLPYTGADIPAALEEYPGLSAVIVATSSQNTVIVRGESVWFLLTSYTKTWQDLASHRITLYP